MWSDLVEHLGRQHQVVPAEPRGQPPRREVGGVVGLARPPGGQHRSRSRGERQRRGHRRPAGSGGLSRRDEAAARSGCSGANSRIAADPGRGVGAGDQEERRLAGRQEGAARRRRAAAELGEAAVERRCCARRRDRAAPAAGAAPAPAPAAAAVAVEPGVADQPAEGRAGIEARAGRQRVGRLRRPAKNPFSRASIAADSQASSRETASMWRSAGSGSGAAGAQGLAASCFDRSEHVHGESTTMERVSHIYFRQVDLDRRRHPGELDQREAPGQPVEQHVVGAWGDLERVAGLDPAQQPLAPQEGLAQPCHRGRPQRGPAGDQRAEKVVHHRRLGGLERQRRPQGLPVREPQSSRSRGRASAGPRPRRGPTACRTSIARVCRLRTEQAGAVGQPEALEQRGQVGRDQDQPGGAGEDRPFGRHRGLQAGDGAKAGQHLRRGGRRTRRAGAFEPSEQLPRQLRLGPAATCQGGDRLRRQPGDAAGRRQPAEPAHQREPPHRLAARVRRPHVGRQFRPDQFQRHQFARGEAGPEMIEQPSPGRRRAGGDKAPDAPAHVVRRREQRWRGGVPPVRGSREESGSSRSMTLSSTIFSSTARSSVHRGRACAA